MRELIDIFKKHFSDKVDYIKIIRKLKHQRENWFLVEIIKSLTDRNVSFQDQPSYNGINGRLDISINYNN